jgi:hypothetical protein
MAQRRRELRPSVESFESRALLSTGIGSPSAIGGILPPGPARTIRLDGFFSGPYQVNAPIPDVGRDYLITGSGIVGVKRTHAWRIHHASITGELHSLGFISHGNAQGDLTLKGPHGTLKVHLTGPQQARFQPLPSQFSFTTSGGTGSYRRIRESGMATLDLTPAQTGTGGPGSGQDTFTLLLKSG